MNKLLDSIKQIPWSRAGEFVPGISFLGPSFLWLLLLIPVLVGVYYWLLQRRKQGVLRYGNMGLLKQAMGPSNWRRHLPPAQRPSPPTPSIRWPMPRPSGNTSPTSFQK